MPSATEKAFRFSLTQHQFSKHLHPRKKNILKSLIAFRNPFGVNLNHRLGNRLTDMPPKTGEVTHLHTSKASSSEVRKKNSIQIKIEPEASATSSDKVKKKIAEGTGVKSRIHLKSEVHPVPTSTSSTYLEQSISHQLQAKRQRLVDTLMSSVLACLERKLDTFEAPCDDGDAKGESSSHGASNVKRQQGNQQSTAGSKRQLREDDSDGCENRDHGDDDRRDKHNKRPKRVTKDTESKIWACPYYQYDPERFKAHRTCSIPSFKEIHRIKEHVLRKHELGKQCNRCCEFFKTEKDLKDHQRSDEICPVVKKDRNYSDGFDKDQAKKLNERPRMGPEDRWRHIYCILFNIEPSSPDIPSPYHEFSGPRTAASNPRQKTHSRTVVNIVREKLPSLVQAVVQSEVSKATSAVEQTILPNVVQEVRNSLQSLLHVVQSIQPPSGASLQSSDGEFVPQTVSTPPEKFDVDDFLSCLPQTWEPEDAFDFDSINDGSTHDFSSVLSSDQGTAWLTNSSMTSIEGLEFEKENNLTYQQPLNTPGYHLSAATDLYPG